MHDIATINTLNRQAHEKAITGWRAAGKHVVTLYAGLHLMAAEPHDSRDSADRARSAYEAAAGASERVAVLEPDTSLVTGGRDQSEDYCRGFATVSDYLQHQGCAG